MKRHWIALLFVAGCGRGSVEVGRLAFLEAPDATRAYVLDSAWKPGVELDPPYVPGDNSLCVLAGVGDALRVEQTLPLGPQGFVRGLALSPDGDTALVARSFPHELIVVRGLRTGEPRVHATLPLPTPPGAMAFSPDGTYALVGDWTGPTSQGAFAGVGGPLVLYLVVGLPVRPVVIPGVDLGPEEEIDCGNVASIGFTPDGRRAIALTWVSITHDEYYSILPAEVRMHLIEEPGPGGARSIRSTLDLPLEPVIPAPPPLDTVLTGTIGSMVLQCHGDSAILAATGSRRFGLDARIALVDGILSDQLRLARILGPDDGVPMGPNDIKVLPDCDRAIGTTVAGDFFLLSGLRDSTFASISIERIPAGRPGRLALAADGAILLVSKPQPPRDNWTPALVTQHSMAGGEPVQIGEGVSGPVRRAPATFNSASIQTFPSTLQNYIEACAPNLPPETARTLMEGVQAAVASANRGADSVAISELVAFRSHVESLRTQGALPDAEARVLDALAGLAEERLGPER